jgi:fermentation-respiration switch protein FrsA (DUF1100 family)
MLENKPILGSQKNSRYWKHCLLFLLLLCAGCRQVNNVDKSFIFFPGPTITETPETIGLPFEDLYLTTKDKVRINAWFIPYPNAKTTLLWFHGNAGNMSDRIEQIQRFHDRLRVSILMIDYREYGNSDGSVSEEGTYLDAEAVFDHLLARPDTGKIVVYGQSLGSGIAVELVLRRKVDALILEAPFLSIRHMAKVQYNPLPLGWFITTEYNNLRKIGKVSVPLLIFHGDNDETIPHNQGQQLFASAKDPKFFYTIPNGGHNDVDIVGGESYFEVFADFLEKKN